MTRKVLLFLSLDTAVILSMQVTICFPLKLREKMWKIRKEIIIRLLVVLDSSETQAKISILATFSIFYNSCSIASSNFQSCLQTESRCIIWMCCLWSLYGRISSQNMHLETPFTAESISRERWAVVQWAKKCDALMHLHLQLKAGHQ